ncbi:cob(I)yrinic acid a,c-diamide adenosyltransferase [Candidatus Micrarchaeota archaeon]|nr:cob(I)yrinic acid a,c-diamide adenosyltransferase [Candidatus Micrarchaeota archaeon]
MAIYTRQGDTGQTALFGGKRIPKSSVRINAIGSIDELNSTIGFARALNPRFKKNSALHKLQKKLFVAGADLATPFQIPKRMKRMTANDAMELEKEIDALEKALPPLKHFILPGGSLQAAALHHARSVSRRAERAVVILSEKEVLNPHLLPFLNRISDFLFVMARQANSENEHAEEEWMHDTGP